MGFDSRFGKLTCYCFINCGKYKKIIITIFSIVFELGVEFVYSDVVIPLVQLRVIWQVQLSTFGITLGSGQ